MLRGAVFTDRAPKFKGEVSELGKLGEQRRDRLRQTRASLEKLPKSLRHGLNLKLQGDDQLSPSWATNVSWRGEDNFQPPCLLFSSSLSSSPTWVPTSDSSVLRFFSVRSGVTRPIDEGRFITGCSGALSSDSDSDSVSFFFGAFIAFMAFMGIAAFLGA